ncbi:MAG TPA: hypothetical protein PLP29_03510 [Candidatus Ozemobacteraceae bacterium]|nr:hypothetical protein [Candidatus Ozemobacteraceae bacterium]
MKHTQRSELRYFAFLSAFCCSMVFSGCGSSSDGGANPAGLLPAPTVRGGVEGYVSRDSVARSLRARIASTLSEPFADARVTLYALDPENGSEQVLGTGQSDDRGYYQISYAVPALPARNLIVQAFRNGETAECVVPGLKQGAVVRAPTMDPESRIQAKIVRELGRFGKADEISLGELTALVPEETLTRFDGQLGPIVQSLLAMDEARRLKFGERFKELSEAAFNLHQSMIEAVENGEISAEEARLVYLRKLEEQARGLGFTSEDLSALDEFENAFLHQPIEKLLPGLGESDAAGSEFAATRLRETKHTTLALVADAVTTLVGEKSRTEYAGFYQLIDKMRGQLDLASTPADIRAVFDPRSGQMAEFTHSLGTILASLGFTQDLIDEVFDMQPPGLIESASADGLTKVSAAGGASGFEPAGLVRHQNRILEELKEAVRHVAEKAALTLSEEQLKAIALLIRAKAPEKLDFEVPEAGTAVSAPSAGTGHGEAAPGEVPPAPQD